MAVKGIAGSGIGGVSDLDRAIGVVRRFEREGLPRISTAEDIFGPYVKDASFTEELGNIGRFAYDVGRTPLEAARLAGVGIGALTDPTGNIFSEMISRGTPRQIAARQEAIRQDPANRPYDDEILRAARKSTFYPDEILRAAQKDVVMRDPSALGGALVTDAGGVTEDIFSALPSITDPSALGGDALVDGEVKQQAERQAQKAPEDLGDVSDEFKLDEEKTETSATTETVSPYQQLLQESIKSYNDMMGLAPSGAKTIDEYKKEFSEATGIDISGEPDNRAALIAFGTALMQNKAGKGFNVAEILSDVGAAGEKALPVMERARQEARQGQIAAGKFALGQRDADIKARQGFVVDQMKYLRDRRDAILAAELKRAETIEDRDALAQIELNKQAIKFQYDKALKYAQLQADALQKQREGKFKTTDTKDLEFPGLKDIKVTMAIRESDGSPVFLYPKQDATGIGAAYADMQEALNTTDKMIELINKAAQQPGGVNVQKATEFVDGVIRSFGGKIGEEAEFDKNGNFTGFKTKAGPLRSLQALQDRLINQYKRFLTQETGNGISNVDVQRVEALLGKIDFFGDPAVALERIKEVQKIFESKKQKIGSVLSDFGDKTRFQNEKEYLDTRQAINESIKRSYGYDLGVPIIEDEATGLSVFKVSD